MPENKPETLDVKSNIFFGALNVFLTILVYFFVIVSGLIYLKYFHEIDVVNLISTSLSYSGFPFSEEMLRFLEFLVEDILTTTAVLGLIYAAFISNYSLRIENNKVFFQKGFLFLDKDSFVMEEIEQVYTEKYPFFPRTKQLCIKALEEDMIKIPYVRNAEKIRTEIISRIKNKAKGTDADEANLKTESKYAKQV